MNPASYRGNVGLSGLPLLFPNANVFDPDYYATKALNGMSPTPPAWVNGDFQKPPQFNWGSRVGNAPPNIPFPGYFNINATQDVSISLTKVAGRHTYKMGYYQTHSYKAEQATDTNSFGTINFQQDAVGHEPVRHVVWLRERGDRDVQLLPAGVEVRRRQLRLRQHRVLHPGQLEGRAASSRWTTACGSCTRSRSTTSWGRARTSCLTTGRCSGAPQLYKPGCTITVAPGTACPAANRQAQNPDHRRSSSARTRRRAFGTLVPGSGSATNGLFTGGWGIVDTTYTFPALGIAPRFGMAYDLTDSQKVVLRGGMGLFFDRPFGNSVISMAGNPPSSQLVTTRYSQLQNLGSGGSDDARTARTEHDSVRSEAAVVHAVERRASSCCCRGRFRWTLEYVGQHSFNTVRTVNINTVDFGTAFLPQNQDTTLATSATPGATAYQTDLLRSYRGYGGDQPSAVRRLADVSLDSDLLQPPLPERPVVQLQRHDRALRSAERRRAPPARGRRHVLVPRRPGAGGRAARQQQPGSGTCSAPTSSGTCPTFAPTTTT